MIENFAHVVEEAKPQLKIERVVVATAGDLMGFKGHIVNFVARRIKKVVKPFDLPGFVPLATVLAGSDAMAPVTVTPDDIAFLQYTGGTTASPRARRCRTATSPPMSSNAGCGSAGRWSRRSAAATTSTSW